MSVTLSRVHPVAAGATLLAFASAALLLVGALLLLATPAEGQSPPVQFVAGATSGGIAYSYDGITWAPAANTPTFQHVWATGFNGTHWVAAAWGTVWISTDGINWQDYPIPFPATTWGGVTWGDGHWTIAGGDFSVPPQPVVITSTDGINWSPGSMGLGMQGIRGVTHNGDTWVAGGARGLAHSADGITWNYVGDQGLGSGFDIHVRAQIYCWGTWYAASSITGGMASSTDGGATWTLGPTVGSITKFATNGAIVVAVGNSGSRIWTSSDMNTWTPRPNPLTDDIYAVTYGDGLFVAATWTSGQVVTSPDGITWTLRTPPWPSAQILSLSSREGNEPRICQEARPDSYTFNEDQSGQSFDVLTNDVTQFGPLTVTAHTVPGKGTLTGPVGGLFTYTPDPDAVGADSFTYTATNANGQTSTATVSITVNPVNDPPSFTGDAAVISANPVGDQHLVPGWATLVRAGPTTASDEVAQALAFTTTYNSNAGLFASDPALHRSDTATSTTPSASGSFGFLEFTPSGLRGQATVCFTLQDSGGNATVTNQWGDAATGQDTSAPQCAHILLDDGPVAYFEPTSTNVKVGESLAFDSCPRAPPRCSTTSSDAAYEWSFGDGNGSNLTSPTHAFDRPGEYLVRLTVSDTYGARASYSATVFVDWEETQPAPEQHPTHLGPLVVDAGYDRTVREGTVVPLLGGHEGGYGTPRFLWTQVAGTPVQISDAKDPQPTFMAPLLPTMNPIHLAFRLEATDGASTAHDHVILTVASANRAPTAAVERDLEAVTGALVVLDGSASTDLDGDAMTYRWEQVLTPGAQQVTLSDASSASPHFTAPSTPALLHFRVSVSDGKATGQAQVTVTVVPEQSTMPGEAKESPQGLSEETDFETVDVQTTPWHWIIGGLGLFVVGALAFWAVRRD